MEGDSGSTLVRVTLAATDDSEGQQKVRATGRDSEQFGGSKRMILTIGRHGFSSVAPDGSTGLVLSLGDNPDQAVALGLEHDEHRPKKKTKGSSHQYDAAGQIIELINGEKCLMTLKELEINVEGTVTIKANKIVLESPLVYLGAEAGAKRVGIVGTLDDVGNALVEDGAATRVFAV